MKSSFILSSILCTIVLAGCAKSVSPEPPSGPLAPLHLKAGLNDQSPRWKLLNTLYKIEPPATCAVVIVNSLDQGLGLGLDNPQFILNIGVRGSFVRGYFDWMYGSEHFVHANRVLYTASQYGQPITIYGDETVTIQASAKSWVNWDIYITPETHC